jgi:type I restriction enzyme S subunit
LIIKMQAIKRGMSQQLLTGQTRVPGFNSDWKHWHMDSLGSTYGGLTGKAKDDFEVGDGRYIPFMAVMSGLRVTASSLLRVRVAPQEHQNVVASGDLLFNTSSETPDELALCAVASDLPANTYLNSFSFGFRLLTPATADPLFLAYIFRSDIGRRLMNVLAQGATRYNLAKSQFREITLLLPSVDEQRAIATVLSDADEVVATLSSRLEKARAIKQGMMQELLTGHTRLPVEKGTA